MSQYQFDFVPSAEQQPGPSTVKVRLGRCELGYPNLQVQNGGGDWMNFAWIDDDGDLESPFGNIAEVL